MKYANDYQHNNHVKVTSVNSSEIMQEKMEKRVGFAIFGFGRAGTIHFKNLLLNPKGVLRYVVDQDKCLNEIEAVLKVHWRMESVSVVPFSKAEEVMKDNSVDAVIISTPTNFHEEIVKLALSSGKAVFCEKPVALTYPLVSACYQLAVDKKLPLMCAFNRRFDPANKSIRSRVKNGEIGSVHIIKICSRDSPEPSSDYLKISGGIFHDCVVHDIDIMCWMVGEFPTHVSVFGESHDEKYSSLGDVDTAVIILKFASGVRGTIDVSRKSVYGYDQRVEVFGERGMLASHNQRPTGIVMSSDNGCQSEPIYYSFPSRYHESYTHELDHFIDVVRGVTELNVLGEQTLKVSRVADACEKSCKSGQTIEVNYETS